MSPRQNASTPRTRRRIHDALLMLAESHDVMSINVNQLTKAAGLNRTTFYLHYPDIDALLDAVIDELMVQLNEGGQHLLASDGEPDQEWQETFFRTIAEHPRLFLRLFQSTHQDRIVGRLLTAHREFFLARWAQLGLGDEDTDPPLPVRAAFAAGGVHAMTIDWLAAGMPAPPERVCAWAMELGMRAAPVARLEGAEISSK